MATYAALSTVQKEIENELLPPPPQALRRWRAPALAAAALLGAPLAWGACVDTATQGKADGGSTCTATRSAYTNNEDTLLAETGGQLTVPNSVTFNAGGTMTMWGGIVRADGTGSKIEFSGDVTLTQEDSQHSYGLYANNGGQISVSGTTNVPFLPCGTDNRYAAYARGADSQITLGAVSLTAAPGGSGVTCYGLVTQYGGKITYTTATINAQDSVVGIKLNGAEEVIGGDTTVNISASGYGSGVESAGLVRINGTLNVIGNARVDGLSTNYDGQIHVGANSKIQGAYGIGVNIMGYNATPLMAGNGLQINYTDTGSFAFRANNTAAASTTLANATVTAETLWLATGSDYTFNAQGGAYTGKSMGNPQFTLNMSNSAVWNLNDTSSVGKMELTGNSVLKLDTSHTLTASDAAGVKNTSGIIDLKDATPATGDVLTIAGNYAGGGKLKLDVNLASGGGGAIGVDADALKVTGNVTGSTQIEVTQLPGTGIATTGNGILVAEISGTSPANAFTLLSPVISGGFQYTLHQVGNRWYLQSSLYTGANVASVPTLSHLGLLLTGGLLAGAAARARRKQKKA